MFFGLSTFRILAGMFSFIMGSNALGVHCFRPEDCHLSRFLIGKLRQELAEENDLRVSSHYAINISPNPTSSTASAAPMSVAV